MIENFHNNNKKVTQKGKERKKEINREKRKEK